MRLLNLALLLLALPLSAATRYTVDVETTGDVLQPHLRATVLAEGKQRRVDVVRESRPFAYDVLLSDDGGTTFVALNTALQTWYQIGMTPLQYRPRIYKAAPGVTAKARDVEVTVSDEPSEPIAGFATHKYVVKISFKLRSPQVDQLFGATILLWTTGAVDAALAIRAIDLSTGIPDVDDLLAPAFANVPGFPLKIVLSATRVYTGGRPQTFTATATVSDIRTVAARPHAFERPAAYVYQEPIVSGATVIQR